MDFAKNQKRRKSLDEALINPLKSIIGAARGRRTIQDDGDNIKLDGYFSAIRRQRQSSDHDLKRQLQDPSVQERLRLMMSHTSTLKDEIFDIDEKLKIEKYLIRNSTGRKSKSDVLKILKENIGNAEISSPKEAKKNERKSGHRRRKSENEILSILRHSPLNSPSLTRSLSFENESKKNVIADKTVEKLRKKSKHKRTKSENEALVTSYVRCTSTRTSSLLEKSLQDTEPKNHSESESEPIKVDRSIKGRILNALSRSSSFKDKETGDENHDKKQTNKDDPAKIDKSLKERIKNVIGRSSSFKESKGKNGPEDDSRKRSGSENEVGKTKKERTVNRRSRSSSFKNSKEKLSEGDTDDSLGLEGYVTNSRRQRRKSENELKDLLPENATVNFCRNSVARSSSTNESNTRKRMPGIVRRLSRQKVQNKDNSIDVDDDETSSEPDVLGSPRPSPTNSVNNETNDANLSSTNSPSLQYKNGYLRNKDTILQGKNKQNETIRKMSVPIVNRSMSVGDVLAGAKINDKQSPLKGNIHRQYSLREERSKYLSTVAPSPLILRASHEQLISTYDKKYDMNFVRDSPKKKRKIPFVNRMQKISSDSNNSQKFDNKRLEKLVSDILEAKMRNLTYDHKSSNDRCRLLSKNIEIAIKERLLASTHEYKIIALVYIGETKDCGIGFATQCSYEPSEDLYATATYEGETLFVCACVMASLIPESIAEIME
ncbi:uncharacterized protein LOC130612292 [Hydractinia symbiolongicarpus]|uniref:uncharacterized protein LOC130612292 n=1 Tax=Hydractinia symbiolongicarpus TaxID=13093 RepID=UPI00254DB4D4|nr:uncharacterized protein LOC130612292 [Hydractinia symbiolongicarpus]